MKMTLYGTAICLMMALAGCSSLEEPATPNGVMEFTAEHPNAGTRLTATAFEARDRVGLYITEQNAGLAASGNYITNAPLEYDGTEWNTPAPIYWNDGTYCCYAYYPYRPALENVTDMPVSVALTQQEAADYMNSDFLWASRKDVAGGNGKVSLQFSHCMSRLFIRLVKSADYEGELPQEAQVFIHNTVTEATADLNVGIVTPRSDVPAQSIRAKSEGNHFFSAIVVPQKIRTREPLIEVIMNGVSYLYETRFIFRQGFQHNIQLVISDNPEKIRIEIGGEIPGWQN